MSGLVHISVKNNQNLFISLRKEAIEFLDEIQPKNIQPNKEIIVAKIKGRIIK